MRSPGGIIRANELELTKCPKIWPSVMRLVATLAIFLFHFLGLLGYYRYRLDLYSIIIFSFLSGYLSTGIHRDGTQWLKKRYFNIMVPYWIIIIPILYATVIFSYKPITLLKVLAALSGCNMFVNNPVYVDSWYITYVLLLYLYIFIESSFQQHHHYILFVPIGLFVFSFLFHKTYYFIAFIVGLRLSPHYTMLIRSYLYHKVSSILFLVQRYCYPFFLIHGSVLLFFTRKTSIHPIFILLISFISTCAFSVILHAMSQPIQVWITRQGIKRTAQQRLSPSQ